MVSSVAINRVSEAGATDFDVKTMEYECNFCDYQRHINDSNCNDCGFYLEKGYPVLAAFPDKTDEQLAMIDNDPTPTMSFNDLPSQFSWRNNGGDWTTPVKDAGACGSSWAFSALGAMEAAINIASGNPHTNIELSVQYILSCLSAAGSCAGGLPSTAISYIKSTSPGNTGNGVNGVCTESCMPYQADDTIPCNNKCDNWDYVDLSPIGILWQIEEYGITSGNPNSEAYWNVLKNWLMTYGPLSVDMYASSGWNAFWSNNNNPNAVYEGTESGTTNHAVTLVGWKDDFTVKDGGYWIAKNSWGTGWGYGGYYNCAYGSLNHGDRDVVWVTTPEWSSNNPPNKPSTPSGPAGLEIGEEGTYSTSASDPDGDLVQYRFNWGDGTFSVWTPLDLSGHTGSLSYSWDTPGNYLVKAQARDEHGAESSWSNGLTVVVEPVENTPPTTPTSPVGQTNVEVYESGNYSTSASDPGGDLVQYRFDWDADGVHIYSDWTPLNVSGHTGSLSYSWDTPGDYLVKAQARDEHGAESSWSNGLTVVVSDTPDDITPPTIEIIKPLNKLYIFNNVFFNLPIPVIIGSIDIETRVTDDESGVYKVLFYVQGDLKETIYDTPYTWTWDTPASFQSIVKIVAYDNAGNSNEVEFRVLKFF
ncbi:MAG: C1 family peptidase [Thermoplasmatota archaeon]